MLACGAIGFLDDLIKVRHRRSLGLSGRIKMLLLLAISAVVCVAAHHQGLRHAVFVPIVQRSIPLGWGWYVLVFIIIAGSANAVNLTDGLDGLAAGTSIIALFTLTAMAVTIYIRNVAPNGNRIANRLDAAYIGAAMIGAAVGFLWFNAFPAEVFMGDTGAMALGGAIGAMAIFLQVAAAALLVGGDLRDRGALGRDPGDLVPLLGETGLPDGADPPPLRDEVVVRDEDHGALLDRRRDPLRGRLRALLQVLPEHPARTMRVARLRARALRAVRRPARLEARGDEVVRVDRSLGNEDDLGAARRRRAAREVARRARRAAARRGGARAAGSRSGRSSSSAGACSLRRAPASSRVTGTNGKTTTSELLGAIFRAAGRDVAVAGNVGTPLSSIAAADWVVCEVSSFQLEDVHAFACEVAVLLNLEPDHLDRHGTFEAYRAAKLRIFERAAVGGRARGASASPGSSSRPTTRCRPSR